VFTDLHALVVDDSVINQLLICKILENQGVTSEVAFNGEEAIQKVAETHYDLIFMDIQMPDVDGYQAAKTIRKMKGRKNLPIIAVTANTMPEDQEKCLQAGMNHYISKPVHAKQILEIIKIFYGGDRSVRTDDYSLNDSPSRSLFEKVHQDLPFMQQMVINFEDTYHQSLSELRNAIEEQDFQKIYQCAHALKGLSGVIEATRAAEILVDLEQKSKLNTIENMLSLLESFETEVQLILSAHKAFLLDES
jgi:two-component system, sensor histidine kinase and response regulator